MKTLISISRYYALENTVELLPYVVTVLENMMGDATVQAFVRGDTLKLLKNIQSFDFVATLTICHLIMSCTHDLCSNLQGERLTAMRHL